MPRFQNSIKFLNDDYPFTLFPLELNRIMISTLGEDIAEHVYLRILNEKSQHFLQQIPVYASKPGMHLRRTVKLDPVAEFFIYDLIYRNRNSFRKDFSSSRRNFGYRFKAGTIISSMSSYRAFKAAVSEATNKYSFGVKFDISSYFNSIYHHDLVAWFNDGNRSEDDVQAFDIFLKHTNSGRSVDLLPQGIAPCKVIGSHFLKFIDNSNRLKSDLFLRFMDDFYLFSNDLTSVLEDFDLIQRLLGEKGLSVNPLKTRIGDVAKIDVKREVDAMKIDLLKTRRTILERYGEEIELEYTEELILNKTQVEYLFNLLKAEDIEEEDGELVLTLMRDHGHDVAEYIGLFLERFPNLSRNIFHFCQYIPDKSSVAEQVYSFLKERRFVTEYQLFWLAQIAEKYLLETKRIGDILQMLYEHPNACTISQAKILEIPEHRFGMGDLREEHLRTGKSDWLAWAAAMGCRKEKKANRNHLLTYFSHGSPMNRLISDCVLKL